MTVVRTGYLTPEGRAAHRERVARIRAASPLDQHGPKVRNYRNLRREGFTAAEAAALIDPDGFVRTVTGCAIDPWADR